MSDHPPKHAAVTTWLPSAAGFVLGGLLAIGFGMFAAVNFLPAVVIPLGGSTFMAMVFGLVAQRTRKPHLARALFVTASLLLVGSLIAIGVWFRAAS